jgi:hypothetical protein
VPLLLRCLPYQDASIVLIAFSGALGPGESPLLPPGISKGPVLASLGKVYLCLLCPGFPQFQYTSFFPASAPNAIVLSPDIIFPIGFMPFYTASSLSKAVRELKIGYSLYVIIETRVLNSLFKPYNAIVIKILLLTIASDSRNIIAVLLTLFRYLTTSWLYPTLILNSIL